jgi:RES domain-containing protein
MSSATWTPAALSRERRALAGSGWRAVEAQHRVSTMKLVDTVEEQEALETLLEATKPPIPPECRRLDYLLFTPFRYGAPYPAGSRFRRAGFTPAVFYASETASTAIAEMAFHRLLFFADSPDTPWPVNGGEYTVFSVPFKTGAGLDLTTRPLVRDRALWTDRLDYGACQQLADAARSAGTEVIRYESVRDPAIPAGANIAILTCRAFAARRPAARQTWRIHLGPYGARAMCDFPEQRRGFPRAAFAADRRIASLRWERSSGRS